MTRVERFVVDERAITRAFSNSDRHRQECDACAVFVGP